MNSHPLTRLTKKEALLYAAVCDMYAEDGEQTKLEIADNGELFMSCKSGVYTIWHGQSRIEEWRKECKSI